MSGNEENAGAFGVNVELEVRETHHPELEDGMTTPTKEQQRHQSDTGSSCNKQKAATSAAADVVQVVVRMMMLTGNDKFKSFTVEENERIVANNPRSSAALTGKARPEFKFDKVLNSNDSHTRVFSDVGANLVQQLVVDQTNSLVISSNIGDCGSTSHSVVGNTATTTTTDVQALVGHSGTPNAGVEQPNLELHDDAGLIPHILEQVCAQLDDVHSLGRTVSMSCMEVYNGNVRCLLSPNTNTATANTRDVLAPNNIHARGRSVVTILNTQDEDGTVSRSSSRSSHSSTSSRNQQKAGGKSMASPHRRPTRRATATIATTQNKKQNNSTTTRKWECDSRSTGEHGEVQQVVEDNEEDQQQQNIRNREEEVEVEQEQEEEHIYARLLSLQDALETLGSAHAKRLPTTVHEDGEQEPVLRHMVFQLRLHAPFRTCTEFESTSKCGAVLSELTVVDMGVVPIKAACMRNKKCSKSKKIKSKMEYAMFSSLNEVVRYLLLRSPFSSSFSGHYASPAKPRFVNPSLMHALTPLIEQQKYGTHMGSVVMLANVNPGGGDFQATQTALAELHSLWGDKFKGSYYIKGFSTETTTGNISKQMRHSSPTKHSKHVKRKKHAGPAIFGTDALLTKGCVILHHVGHTNKQRRLLDAFCRLRQHNIVSSHVEYIQTARMNRNKESVVASLHVGQELPPLLADEDEEDEEEEADVTASGGSVGGEDEASRLMPPSRQHHDHHQQQRTHAITSSRRCVLRRLSSSSQSRSEGTSTTSSIYKEGKGGRSIGNWTSRLSGASSVSSMFSSSIASESGEGGSRRSSLNSSSVMNVGVSVEEHNMLMEELEEVKGQYESFLLHANADIKQYGYNVASLTIRVTEAEQRYSKVMSDISTQAVIINTLKAEAREVATRAIEFDNHIVSLVCDNKALIEKVLELRKAHKLSMCAMQSVSDERDRVTVELEDVREQMKTAAQQADNATAMVNTEIRNRLFRDITVSKLTRHSSHAVVNNKTKPAATSEYDHVTQDAAHVSLVKESSSCVVNDSVIYSEENDADRGRATAAAATAATVDGEEDLFFKPLDSLEETTLIEGGLAHAVALSLQVSRPKRIISTATTSHSIPPSLSMAAPQPSEHVRNVFLRRLRVSNNTMECDNNGEQRGGGEEEEEEEDRMDDKIWEQIKCMPPALKLADPAINTCSNALCLACFGDTVSMFHCRSCGECFCRDCTQDHIELPWFGYTDPVRVCKCCFEIFSSEDLSRRGHEEENISRQLKHFDDLYGE